MIKKLNHLGIIMDGNRRFAKKLLKNPLMGHNWGAKKLNEVFEWCREKDIRIITIYALSLENLNTRPKKEINFLMDLFRKELKSKNFQKKIHKTKTRIKFLGKKEFLPEDIQELMKQIIEETKNYENYELNFAVAYSGRQEILDAIKKLDKKNIDSLNEKTFEKYLYTHDMTDPDLIIRTSGEKRISGFLLWQSAYSEYCFIDKLWPEITKEDFMVAIKDYNSRQRRFGS